MIITNSQYNFTKAEDETFSWNDISKDMLTYKPTGKLIYQMEWYEWKNSQPITDKAIIKATSKFWDELHKLQTHPRSAHKVIEVDPQPQHGENGYCRKCHSWCWGDCEA